MAGSSAWRRLAAVLVRDRLPALARKHRAPLVTLAVVAVLVWWAWPPTGHPIRFPDSKGYFNWPLRSVVDGVEWMGWRPVGYPLVLYVTGTGAVLVHLQTWLSLGSWCLLGWLLARNAGVAVAGLLALSPAIRPWNLIVLTESLTLSLLALLIAAGLLALRRGGPFLLGSWALIATLFSQLKDSNLLLLPFLLIPFLERGRRTFVLAALLVIVLILGGLITSQHNRRWVIPYYTAMFFKVRPFETESVMFYEAGMPETGLSLRDEEFYDWFLARGQSTYQRWVITRLGSYTEAWEQLVKDGESEALDEEYFRRLARYPSPSIAQPALFLFEMSAPPQAVWICILLLPALDWLRNRRLGLLSLWTASLVLATYVQVFFGYHGAGVETVRHTLTGSILYRITFLVGLYTAFSILRTGRRRGRGG